MSEAKTVFERHEKKYRMTLADYNRLRQQLEPYMQEDEYGLHTISSIYYDTDSFEIIRASTAKPVYKEKLRLRAYGVPGAEDNVFLELKKKYDGVVYKRRIVLPLWEAKAYLEEGILPQDQGQIFQEIDWFVQRYQPSAKILIAYDRIALYGREDKGLRVTFDFRARWREDRLDLAKGNSGHNLLSPQHCLMEIKTGNAMPVWLADILAGLGIYPASFSKYGACYTTNLLDKGAFRHAG